MIHDQVASTFSQRLKNGLQAAYHIAANATQGFVNDGCYNKAAALTYYAVLSIVPFFAAILGLARGFGMDDYLTNLIVHQFEEQKEVLDKILYFANATLQNIKQGWIAGVGIAFLLWTNINLLANIETTFNDIWRVKISRSFTTRIKDFITFILFCPLVLLLSSSLTVYLQARISHVPLPYVEITFSWLFKLVPLFLSCLLFSFLYFLIPNTRMFIVPRIFASIIAGVAFQMWQLIYIKFQFLLFNYSTVYGAFAAVPLFLVWLQFSWLIALFGAEIAFHIENDLLLLTQRSKEQIEVINQHQLGLLVLHECLQPFLRGDTPRDDLQIANALKAPLNDVQTILATFEHHLLLKVSDGNDTGYLPKIDLGAVDLFSVCQIIDAAFRMHSTAVKSPVLDNITHFLSQMDQACKHSAGNISVRDFVSE